MPKISDDRRSQRRRQIAAAALRCFIRQGFEATSMADIVTDSALYKTIKHSAGVAACNLTVLDTALDGVDRGVHRGSSSVRRRRVADGSNGRERS